MSRHPFKDYSNDLLLSRTGVYSAATLARERRRYERMHRDILTLYQKGKISTTSPARFTLDDIVFYLTQYRDKHYTQSEYKHELFSLGQICEYAGSSVVNQALARFPLLKPVSGHYRLPVLTDAQVDLINAAVLQLSGFSGLRAAAAVSISLGCGARTKELQFLEISDVDLDSMIVTFRHVKGEGTYGRPRMVPIPPVYHDVLSSYCCHRSKLSGTGFFCTVTGAEVSDKVLRSALGYVHAASGVHFDYRILRRTFGQRLVNAGLDIESVSVLMGHNTTKTTENYYSRRSNAEAVEAMRETFRTGSGSAAECQEIIKKGADDRRQTFLTQGQQGCGLFSLFCANTPNAIGAL